MPGRRNKGGNSGGNSGGGGNDPLRGYESTHHGNRSQIEGIMASGGPPSGAVGGGGDGGMDLGGAAPQPSAPAQPPAPHPFRNPFYDGDGNLIPGDGFGNAPAPPPPFPDDPDAYLRAAFRANPNADLARLLEERTDPHPYASFSPSTAFEGVDAVESLDSLTPFDETPFLEDPGMVGPDDTAPIDPAATAPAAPVDPVSGGTPAADAELGGLL